MQGHVSMREAARIMGVSRQRIHQLLKMERIPGAFRMECGKGRFVWVIPKGSVRPKEVNHG